jgi:protoheme IX farnesyltransferase
MTQLTRHDAVIPLAADPLTLRQRIADFATLSKVRITVMVVLTAWLGFAIGEHAAQGAHVAVYATVSARLIALLGAMIGSALACMGASALNQVYERDTDALMHRTRSRPMPRGRITVAQGGLFGTALAAAGVAAIALTSNALAAGLAAFTVLSYVMIYTPMKRISSTSTIVGAGPGALPPIIGYAAAANALGIEAVAIFAIMFLWQLPHFLAIAWLYREDYARAGFPMLPVLDPAGGSTFRQMILCCTTLVPLGLLPTIIGMCGTAYFVVALAAGLGFLASAVLLMIHRSSTYARIMFFVSLIYLPLVLVMMVVDRT